MPAYWAHKTYDIHPLLSYTFDFCKFVVENLSIWALFFVKFFIFITYWLRTSWVQLYKEMPKFNPSLSLLYCVCWLCVNGRLNGCNSSIGKKQYNQLWELSFKGERLILLRTYNIYDLSRMPRMKPIEVEHQKRAVKCVKRRFHQGANWTTERFHAYRSLTFLPKSYHIPKHIWRSWDKTLRKKRLRDLDSQPSRSAPWVTPMGCALKYSGY